MDIIPNQKIAELQAENKRLKEALQEIKDKQGKVCNRFDTCKHESCQSSYTSWVIAEQALKD